MVLVVVTLLLCVTLFYVLLKWGSKSNLKNPFSEVVIQKLPITDHQEKESLLTNEFDVNKAPNNIDAIIIGSGGAALVSAGIMAKAGKKVVVLEMTDRIGGCTNVYNNNGYTFDIGIHYHYLGDCIEGSLAKVLMDSISGGQLTWNDFSNFDTIMLGKEGCQKIFKYVKEMKNCKTSLLKNFPNEVYAIEKYFNLLQESKKVNLLYTLTKIFPKFLVRIFFVLKLDYIFFSRYKYITKSSLEKVLNDLTNNQQLKAVLSYSFANYGTTPSETSFFVHASLMQHRIETGSYFPKEGVDEIIARCVSEVNKFGGVMYAGVQVKHILFKDFKACGVKIVKLSTNEVFTLNSSAIISNIGIQITLDHLVPKHITDKYGCGSILSAIKPGSSYFQVMIGLRGTKKELKLPTSNYWIYSTNDTEKEMKRYFLLDGVEALKSDFPFLFVSFPSARDTTWDNRYPGKSTCVISFLTNPEWFSSSKKVEIKGTIYNSLQAAFADKAWKRILVMHPHLQNKVDVISSQDPDFSHLHFCHCSHGKIYGMGHNIERFQIDQSIKLRPQTTIPGLYWTGQDIHTVGYMGSMWSGLITAVHLLGCNILFDLLKLWRKTNTRKAA